VKIDDALWFVRLSSGEQLILFMGGILGVALLALLTSHTSLFGVLRQQLLSLVNAMDALRVTGGADSDGANDDAATYRQALGQMLEWERDDIARALRERQRNLNARIRRCALHTLVLGGSFLIALFASTSPIQYLCLISLLTVLWYAAAVDIDHHQVPETALFVLGLALTWVTLSQSAASWTTPLDGVQGLALVMTAVSLSWLVVRMTQMIRQQRTGTLLFGDGDVITLIVLSLYFGVDILTILFVACLAFITSHFFSSAIECGLIKSGHYPVHDKNHGEYRAHMPFLPSIYVGCVSLLATDELFSVRPIIAPLYKNVLATFQ